MLPTWVNILLIYVSMCLKLCEIIANYTRCRVHIMSVCWRFMRVMRLLRHNCNIIMVYVLQLCCYCNIATNVFQICLNNVYNVGDITESYQSLTFVHLMNGTRNICVIQSIIFVMYLCININNTVIINKSIHWFIPIYYYINIPFNQRLILVGIYSYS